MCEDRDAKLWQAALASLWLLLCIVGRAQAGGHPECITCHVAAAGGPLIAPEPSLCLGCHDQRAEHRIGISPTAPPTSPLPLKDGLVTCTTCHDVHASTPLLLRMTQTQLCLACHRM